MVVKLGKYFGKKIRITRNKNDHPNNGFGPRAGNKIWAPKRA
jgi:hypothetical protein